MTDGSAICGQLTRRSQWPRRCRATSQSSEALLNVPTHIFMAASRDGQYLPCNKESLSVLNPLGETDLRERATGERV